MEPSAVHITILRDIEKQAQARPCTLDDLAGLERELKERIAALRREREARREKEVIEAEASELRKAMEAARSAIRSSVAEHERARQEVNWLVEMVRRGHVQEAVKEHARLQLPLIFPDLNCDFVGAAVVKRQAREQWLVAGMLVAAGVILIVVAVIELIKRSAPNSP